MKKILITILTICILVCPVFANTEELLSSMGIMDNLDNTTISSTTSSVLLSFSRSGGSPLLSDCVI